MKKRILFSSSLGTILEWYDFSLFAYLTPLLAVLFFPKENTVTAVMLTYAIFAMGYFVRPLGAIFFGHYGDRIGRKKILIITIVLMSLSTILMGLLPTYQTIGIAAPILLIILRLMQGFSAGGESTGAILFSLESLPKKHRGFLGALLWSMVGIGMLLGSFAATLVLQTQSDWLWRIPFLFGLVTGIIGYYIRRYTSESVLFTQAQHHHSLVKFPLWDGLKKYKSEMFIIIGLYILSAMITYLIYIFMPSYASQIVGLPLKQTSLICTLAFFASTILTPCGGYISDCIGRKICLQIGALGFVIFSYPLFILIAQANLTAFITAEILFVIMACLYQGTLTAAVFELLPTEVRYSLTAVGYSVSYSIFGGTAPLVATFIVNATGHLSSPSWYLVMGAIIAFAASLGFHSRTNS